MRTNQQLKEDLRRLTLERIGFDGSSIQQGSDEWGLLRCGVITASRAKDLISKGRTAGSVGEARTSYLYELIAEVIRGKSKRGAFSGNYATEWGHEHEDSCVGLYGFEEGIEIDHIPFVYGNDAMRYGASPDGLIGHASGIEAKSPYDTVNYLRFVFDGEIKPEYLEQVQFSMFVTGRPSWVLAQHDPEVDNRILHSVVIERDEARMATFADAVGQMAYDMDQKLAQLGYEFGHQWQR